MVEHDAHTTDTASRAVRLVSLGPVLHAEARSFTDDANLSYSLVHEALTEALFGEGQDDPETLSQALRSRAAHHGLVEPEG